MTAYTEDDVERGRAALYANRGRELTTTETARIVVEAVAPAIAARALREAADAMDSDLSWHTGAFWLRARAEQVGGEPDVEVGSNHGDAH